ncbi:MAG: hypothetical protein K0S07_1494, partial [Chlamydiales bacterium]|nr:hypothetical protein [Chlamydiales bacterium]
FKEKIRYLFNQKDLEWLSTSGIETLQMSLNKRPGEMLFAPSPQAFQDYLLTPLAFVNQRFSFQPIPLKEAFFSLHESMHNYDDLIRDLNQMPSLQTLHLHFTCSINPRLSFDTVQTSLHTLIVSFKDCPLNAAYLICNLLSLFPKIQSLVIQGYVPSLNGEPLEFLLRRAENHQNLKQLIVDREHFAAINQSGLSFNSHLQILTDADGAKELLKMAQTVQGMSQQIFAKLPASSKLEDHPFDCFIEKLSDAFIAKSLSKKEQLEQLHAFIISSERLIQELERKKKRKFSSLENSTERALLEAADLEKRPNKRRNILSFDELSTPTIEIFPGYRSCLIHMHHGMQEMKVLLSASDFTILHSSDPVEAQALALILKKAPQEYLAPITTFESNGHLLSERALLTLVQFCPKILNEKLLENPAYLNLRNLKVVFAEGDFFVFKELLQAIWPNFDRLLHTLSKDGAEEAIEAINLSHTTLSASLFRSGLFFYFMKPKIEVMPIFDRCTLLNLFLFFEDFENAEFFLKSLAPSLNTPPENGLQLIALLKMFAPLLHVPQNFTPQIKSMIESYRQRLQDYCDTYIYQQLIEASKTFTLANRMFTHFHWPQFQEELKTIGPFMSSLGHTWEEQVKKNRQSSTPYQVHLTTSLLNALAPLKHITALHLSHPTFLTYDPSNIKPRNIFKKLRDSFPKVSQLHLAHCLFTANAIPDLADWKQLKTLSFKQCRGVGSFTLKHNYLEALHALPHLKSLSLIGCENLQLERGDLAWLPKSSIRHLALDATHIDKNFPALQQEFSLLQALSLDLGESCSEASLANLLQTIRQAPHLTALHLTLEGTMHLIKGTNYPNIRLLTLSSTYSSLGLFFLHSTELVTSSFPNLETLALNNPISLDRDSASFMLIALNRQPSFKRLLVNRELYQVLLEPIETQALNFAVEVIS